VALGGDPATPRVISNIYIYIYIYIYMIRHASLWLLDLFKEILAMNWIPSSPFGLERIPFPKVWIMGLKKRMCNYFHYVREII
jgi:hypothetical protein